MATRAEAEQRVDLGFWIHFGVYVVVGGGLAYLNYTRNPDNLWVLWVAGVWGLGIVLHAALAFLIPQAREKAISRKLERLNRRESQKHGNQMADRMGEARR